MIERNSNDRNDDEVAPPRRAPEQAVMDPVSGMNITGDFVSEGRSGMNEELERIFGEAERRKATGEFPPAIYGELSVQVEETIERHFRILKLPPDELVLKENLERLANILGVNG